MATPTLPSNLVTYLFHVLRRSELAALTVSSMAERRGVMHFRVEDKGSIFGNADATLSYTRGDIRK